MLLMFRVRIYFSTTALLTKCVGPVGSPVGDQSSPLGRDDQIICVAPAVTAASAMALP